MNQLIVDRKVSDVEEELEEALEEEYLIEDPQHNADLNEDPFAEDESQKWPSTNDNSTTPFSDQGDSSVDSTPDSGGVVELPEKKKYYFSANYFVKKYTRQKNGICINEKSNVPEKVFGNNLSEVQRCIWNFVKPHLCREVDVQEADGIKVAWLLKEEPDIRDIHKFVYLRDSKRKTLIKMDQLGEGKLMLNWREKVMNVFAFACSQSISSVAIWEEVNKCLLKPSDTDRAGAPSNVILDELVQDLRHKNSHLRSHDSGWIQWANWIHSSPAHLQESLMTQLPPPELKAMFWSLPVSEGSRAECLREGLVVAQNIVQNLAPDIHALCDKAEQLTNLAFDVKVAAQGLKERLDMCSRPVHFETFFLRFSVTHQIINPHAKPRLQSKIEPN
ncbi:uncharacterized protein LOC134291281 [Aedes albopictus]|uniref:Uncharacterized protein n=1 Tax=Aedes albopictus TaxID=7160 RepID=A0ABM1Z6B7_AEDAL